MGLTKKGLEKAKTALKNYLAENQPNFESVVLESFSKLYKAYHRESQIKDPNGGISVFWQESSPESIKANAMFKGGVMEPIETSDLIDAMLPNVASIGPLVGLSKSDIDEAKGSFLGYLYKALEGQPFAFYTDMKDFKAFYLKSLGGDLKPLILSEKIGILEMLDFIMQAKGEDLPTE